MNQNMTQIYTPATQVDAQGQPIIPNTVQPNPVMFTQEQVNSIVAGRVNSEKAKLTTLQTQLSNTTSEMETLRQQLTAYQNRDVLQNSGIPAYLYDYVAFEATKLAVNGKSFADAVTEFKTAHADLFNQPTNIANQQSIGTPTPGNNTQNANVVQQVIPQVAQPVTQVQPNTQQAMPVQANTVQKMQGILPNTNVNPQVMGNTAQFMGNPQVMPNQPQQVASTGAMFGQVSPSQQAFDANAFVKNMTKFK